MKNYRGIFNTYSQPKIVIAHTLGATKQEKNLLLFRFIQEITQLYTDTLPPPPQKKMNGSVIFYTQDKTKIVIFTILSDEEYTEIKNLHETEVVLVAELHSVFELSTIAASSCWFTDMLGKTQLYEGFVRAGLLVLLFAFLLFVRLVFCP